VRRPLCLGLWLLPLVATACSSPPPLPDSDVLGRIAGEDVRYQEFARYLSSNLGESGGGLESEALSGLLDQFLTEQLLARMAAERKLVRGGVPAAQAVDALLAAEPAAPLTESAIAAYYAEHTAEFRVPERVDLLGILAEDRATCERARRELLAGADFAEVARRLSTGPTAEQGGVLGTVSRDELPADLAELVFALEPGKPSKVVASDNEYRLFEVARRIPEHVRPLVEVRDEILRRLGGARADRAYERLVALARSRYAVQVFDRNLPFVYRGQFPVSRPYENL